MARKPNDFRASSAIYYAGGFGATEQKSSSSESCATYSSTQMGAYMGVERAFKNGYIRGFYGFTHRKMSFDLSFDNETQNIHTVGATLGYQKDGWFVSDIPMFSLGSHDAQRGATTSTYQSYDLRNDFKTGYIFKWASGSITPYVGLLVDYVGAKEYTDSANNTYEAFSQVFSRASTGLALRGDYDIGMVEVSTFIDLSYSAAISGTDVEMKMRNSGSDAITLLRDKVDKGKFSVEAGVNFEVGLDADLRLAYLGSFGDTTKVNGGSLSLRLRDLKTEISLGYKNSYQDQQPGVGDVYFGVQISY